MSRSAGWSKRLGRSDEVVPKYAQIYEGTDQIQRLGMARQLLK